jgi:hypothetical protein
MDKNKIAVDERIHFQTWASTHWVPGGLSLLIFLWEADEDVPGIITGNGE